VESDGEGIWRFELFLALGNSSFWDLGTSSSRRIYT